MSPATIAACPPPTRTSALGDVRRAHDDEPADEAADLAADLTNGDLARVFHEIGDILEVKGELAFKTIAYHRAADAIGRSPVDLVAAYRAGSPPKVPGVGQAISDKITELVTTGHMAYLDRLRAEVPASLVELLQIPGLGPKTVKQLHDELGILTMADLEAAARDGRVRTLRGLSERTEAMILEGIERLERNPRRMLLNQAEAQIDLAPRRPRPDRRRRRRSSPAGSFRRKKETIGDLDLLAETTDPDALMARFTGLGTVDAVIGRGGHKSAVRLMRGPQVDLMVDAARGRRDPPDPLHRQQGAQRPAPRARPRPRLEPERVRLHADRRGRRAADGRRTPSCGRSRPRRRRTRSSICPSSSRSCARTRARSRLRSQARCRC